VITLSTLGGFIECGNGSNLQMDASTLYVFYFIPSIRHLLYHMKGNNKVFMKKFGDLLH
jgi:hypothetical protein